MKETLKAYLDLTRLHFFFVWPILFCSGLFLAFQFHDGYSWSLIIRAVFIGFLGFEAGLVLNDIVDRDIDRKEIETDKLIQKIIYMKQIPNSIVFIDSRKGKFMIEETETENDSGAWKKFLKKHWTMFALFLVAVILAAAGAVYVFLWFVGDAQSTGMVPSTLGLWTMETMVTFVLHAIFWELLLIGVPAILAGVAGWLWWRRLPSDEKKEYHFFGKSSRTTSGGGGISFLFFIAFCIKVFIDGNWNVAIANWTFDYVVDSMISILIWSAIIFGIPTAIGVIWWIRHEMKKVP